MLWSLLKEYRSLGGAVDFHDTGRTFEAADTAAANDYVLSEQAKDGRSYSAVPAPAGAAAAVWRALKRLTGGKVI